MKKSNVKILVSEAANWDWDEARTIMAGLLKKYPGFDAVFAANDYMIMGAIDAMSEAHIDPARKVTVGFDGIPPAFQYMKAGKLSATIDQFPRKQVGQAVEYLVGYIKTKTKPPKVVLIAPELVTKAPSYVEGEVRFPVRDSIELSAKLYRPEGGGPFPAVVLMHGCSGLWFGSGGVHRTARLLRDSGYVVLLVDSLTGRNVSTVCDDPTNKSPTSPERVDDALAARRYLSSLAFVDSSRIGLVGWSHGGTTALITWISRNSVESGTAPFAAIAAYYSYCFDADVRSASGPLLILIGERDDWGPAKLCQSFVERATALGRNASVTVYPGATHAFDCVEFGKSVEFQGHRMTPDPAVERNSRERLLGFLDKTLKKP
jgi:dienelactone hydrolase